MTTLDKPRNYTMTGMELNWAKLATPTSPFGQPIYEIQAATSDAAKAQELRDNFFNVKEQDGKFTVSLKRSATRKDGSDNGKVRVVDGAKMPLDGSKIGNGSTGNIIVWQYGYNQAGRSGVSASLTAVQVTDLVEYTGGGADFDVVAEAPSSSEVSEDTLF